MRILVETQNIEIKPSHGLDESINDILEVAYKNGATDHENTLDY